MTDKISASRETRRIQGWENLPAYWLAYIEETKAIDRQIIDAQAAKIKALTEALNDTQKIPDALLEKTFAIQYNPNCPSPWLVRLVGKGAFIDLKGYSSLTLPEDRTGDILGFGKTIKEAALAAASKEPSGG